MTASGVATPTLSYIEKSASITNSPSGLSSRFPFRIKEIDENGELCRIYESRPSVNNSFDTTRLTSHLMPTSKVSLNSVSTVQYLVNVFLPTGYPYSVTPDYFDYQIFDSFQAFSSSIASLFANRAVLSAIGVGDQSVFSVWLRPCLWKSFRKPLAGLAPLALRGSLDQPSSLNAKNIGSWRIFLTIVLWCLTVFRLFSHLTKSWWWGCYVCRVYSEASAVLWRVDHERPLLNISPTRSAAV